MQRPARKPHLPRGVHGFTLVEVAITLTVVSVLLVAAVTAFGRSLQAARERSVAEKFLQDFTWARGAAAAADASTLDATLSGAPIVTLTLNADCSWTTRLRTASAAAAVTDAGHSMTTAQVAAKSANLSCAGLTLPATFTFDNQGGVATTGVVTFTGATGNWPLSILASGSVIRTKVAS